MNIRRCCNPTITPLLYCRLFTTVHNTIHDSVLIKHGGGGARRTGSIRYKPTVSFSSLPRLNIKQGMYFLSTIKRFCYKSNIVENDVGESATATALLEGDDRLRIIIACNLDKKKRSIIL